MLLFPLFYIQFFRCGCCCPSHIAANTGRHGNQSIGCRLKCAFFFLCCLGHQPSVMGSWRKWHVATASAAGLCLCVCGCNELLMANHKIMARSLRHRYKYTNNQHIDDAVKRKATEMGLNATSGCVATFDLLTISLARRGAGLR